MPITLPITFPLSHSDSVVAEIDGQLLVDDDGIYEVRLEDAQTLFMVTVSGWLADRVVEWAMADPVTRARVTEAMEDEAAGRVVYDREQGRAA